MWYFIAMAILLVLNFLYRSFANIQGLAFGIMPYWMAYLFGIFLLLIIFTLIFGLKTWRPPEQ
jgi:hypothetical protein